MSEKSFLPDPVTRPSADIRHDPGAPGTPAPDPALDPEPDPARIAADEAIGATDGAVGNRTGPAVGYDQEPVQEKDKGGVS